jgi:hypothetical protein
MIRIVVADDPPAMHVGLLTLFGSHLGTKIRIERMRFDAPRYPASC